MREVKAITPPRAIAALGRAAREILAGYGQVYFARQWPVGLLFFLATFMVPVHGAAGLAGLLLANAFARLLGMDREQIREGYFAYNGLLTALAIALTYEMTGRGMALVALASLTVVLVAALFRHIHDRFLGVPVLSLPFMVTAWLFIVGGQGMEFLLLTVRPFEVRFLAGVLPPQVEYFLRTLGAAFFQVNIPAGILVALGILRWSRWAFVQALLSIIVSSWAYRFMGGNPADLTGAWLGFNFGLTAIALGGVFVVPGTGSLLLGLGGSLIAAVVTAGTSLVLSRAGIPVLALPFLFTTMVILLALRARPAPGFIILAGLPGENPEAKFKAWQNARTRQLPGPLDAPAFEMPLRGAWTVTQGVDGPLTHTGAWRHAWDFEVHDDEGKTYRNGGKTAGDYYAWQMPVVSGGDGIVAAVVDTVTDNDVGQVNTRENWGNCVVLWHYGRVYTAYAHLARGSVTVTLGESVRRGHMIGRVGNSGRSPYPHLHFQAQEFPAPGSPTIAASIVNYVTSSDETWQYRARGVPSPGETVQGLEPEVLILEAAALNTGGLWTYVRDEGNDNSRETWRAVIDAPGNQSLVLGAGKGRLCYTSDQRALVLIDYTGPRNCGLAWLFYGMPRLPFGTCPGMVWREELPPEGMLALPARLFFELLRPFGALARLEARCRLAAVNGERFTVETELLFTGLLAPRSKRHTTITVSLERHRGVVALRALRSCRELCLLHQEDYRFNG